MNGWKQFPSIFRRKILLTLLTGLGFGGTGAIAYFVSADRVLLLLGGIILLICICKSISFWICAAGEHYHVLTGTCYFSQSRSPVRLRKVMLVDTEGNATTMLLDRKSGIKNGQSYRLYFQQSYQTQTGNPAFDVIASVDALIGIEEISDL